MNFSEFGSFCRSFAGPLLGLKSARLYGLQSVLALHRQ